MCTLAGIIPVDEFFDAVGSRYCMVCSDCQRRLLRTHLDKDDDGTIDYKQVCAENRERACVCCEPRESVCVRVSVSVSVCVCVSVSVSVCV